MKKILFIFLILSGSAAIAWTQPNHDQNVKIDEARTAAANWIDIIIQKKGSWGGAESAYIDDIQSFKHLGESIGYFCKVLPKGFIILSLRKEFSPIKAYSAINNLNPDSDVGMADLIKGKMAGKIQKIEKRLGNLNKISSNALENILKTNHQILWDKLTEEIIDRSYNTLEQIDEGADVGINAIPVNYQEGYFLLSSLWHQHYPYNAMTPPIYLPTIPPTLACQHGLVGCVATASAQIMRYWNWPPYGHENGGVSKDPYDWPNMLDTIDNKFPLENINAVAELCYEAGVHVDMDYGCDASSADTSDMVDVFNYSFRYSGYIGEISYGSVTLPDNWYEAMKVQFNQNRPILYAIPGHAVVLDGWQELDMFVPTIRQFHMNYGGSVTDPAKTQTTWYTLDESLIFSEHMGDDMIFNIFPAQSHLGTVSGTYTRTPNFPYYYFDRNTEGENAVFESGLRLQFLKGVKLTNTSTAGGIIRIMGVGDFTETETTMFTLSDTVISNGIHIYNGVIEMYGNGSIKIY